jgi:hypothetical protein
MSTSTLTPKGDSSFLETASNGGEKDVRSCSMGDGEVWLFFGEIRQTSLLAVERAFHIYRSPTASTSATHLCSL